MKEERHFIGAPLFSSCVKIYIKIKQKQEDKKMLQVCNLTELEMIKSNFSEDNKERNVIVLTDCDIKKKKN